MKFHQLILAGFHEPKKLAAFRLLPIGRVIRFVFFFILLMTLISFFRFVFGDVALFEASPELEEYSKTIGGLLYPMAFIFQFVIATFYVFVRISIFAGIGMLIGKIRKKRVEYRFLWRTTAIAATVPLFLTIVLDFFPSAETISLALSSFIHICYIFVSLKYYPNAPK
ncbi:DUF1189 family protein [Sporosarcina sp. FSL W8-0480]|uniref:DUF1189 family protein n=1 Tax=Sporosarcina sp. FSL W8-0480 TaxID=2954701 RepID=UPI0030D9011F